MSVKKGFSYPRLSRRPSLRSKICVADIWQDRRSRGIESDAKFIVFEGIDGSGKTTQAKLLAERLEGQGVPVLRTAEPTHGPVGTVIRSLKTRPEPREEARLFADDRRYHVEQVIEPALKKGYTVVCDRFVYSSLAYQGARGENLNEIVSWNKPFALKPDVILLLEVPVEMALSRISAARTNKFSIFEKSETLEAVDEIYRSLSDPLVNRIDSVGAIDEVHFLVVETLRATAVFK